MKRLTRRIGVFGGAGGMISALDAKKSVPAAPQPPKPAPPPAETPKAETPGRRSWFGRLFGSDEE